MLNMKKGLAIVLAAATALTFAPVANLGNPYVAQAATEATDDSYPTSTGIDSLGNLSSLSISKGKTRTLTLKEHKDQSNSGAGVGAYRITVTRPRNDEDTANIDVVGVQNAYEDGDFTAERSDLSSGAYAPAATGTQDAGTSATAKANNQVAELNPAAVTADKNTDYRQYVILNNPTQHDTDGTLKNVNGAEITLVADSTNGGTVTVTIESLETWDSPTALDTQTITVTVPKGDESFTLSKTSGIVAEGETVNVPFVVKNHTASRSYIEITSDNDAVAKGYVKTAASTYAEGKGADTTLAAEATGGKTVNGSIQIRAGEEGDAVLTVNYKKSANGDTVATQTYKLKVTPKNSKLYVSYTAQDGVYRTITDDVAYQTGGNSAYTKAKSGKLTVSDGKLTQGTELAKNADGTLKADNGSGTAVTGKTALTGLGDTDRAEYNLQTLGTLVPAQTLVADGKKTVQISASAVPGAEISYSLVAADSYVDDSVVNSATRTASTETADVKDINIKNQPTVPSVDSTTQQANIDESKLIFDSKSWEKHATEKIQNTITQYGANDKIIFSEEAARPYGSIDNNGLVTLKDAKNAPILYVVVTAKGAAKTATAAKRENSTFMIPINLENQSAVYLHVSDSKFFADADDGTFKTNVDSPIANKIYLSLTDRTSDKLSIVANVGDNYVTGSSSNTNVFTYDNSTHTITAVGEGEAVLTIKTSSAPNYAGIQTNKIRVVVNKLASMPDDTLSLSDVTVSKDDPSKQVEKTVKTAGVGVVFDRTLYKKVDTSVHASGYQALSPTDDGFGDVSVTSTGRVTYNKNSGTVYVRAYAVDQQANQKYNPNKWVYAQVNYGTHVVENTLTVDKSSLIIKTGSTESVKATANTEISFKSEDPSVATVASAGAIQVTGVKEGTTTITVTAAADTQKGIPEKTISIPVVVSDKDVTYQNPAKITGVKIGNKKGAKVVVKFNKDNTSKNIKYYVQKKIGKKTSGKSVGSNKTTLSVKKGATVKVRVKAYYYDANGTKHVGAWSAWKTKKTDKK